jgi:PERQ amino acid-rich with GYF domain-containing protein
MFKPGPASGDGGSGLSNVLTEGWMPGAPASSNNAGWARREDPKDANGGPDICWDQSASVKPLGFIDLDDEEKEVRLWPERGLLRRH